MIKRFSSRRLNGASAPDAESGDASPGTGAAAPSTPPAAALARKDSVSKPRRRVFSFNPSKTPPNDSPPQGRDYPTAPGTAAEEQRPLTRSSMDTTDTRQWDTASTPAARRARKLSKAPPQVGKHNGQSLGSFDEEESVANNSGYQPAKVVARPREDALQEAQVVTAGPSGLPSREVVGADPPQRKEDANRKRLRTDKSVLKARTTLTKVLQSQTTRPAANGTHHDSRHSGGQPGRGQEGHPIPSVTPAKFRELKGQLIKPSEARKIVVSLKDREAHTSKRHPVPSTKTTPDRAVCLGALDHVGAEYDLSQPFQTALQLINLMPTPGSIAGLVGAETGALDALAVLTGDIMARSGIHKTEEGVGEVVPVDRTSFWIYWWGFEIALPPPTLDYLANVESVGRAFLQLARAVTVAGGAPELAPFVSVISNYVDFQWKSIVAQDKSEGVVLAATWVFPVALIPRPWDLARKEITVS